MKKIIKIIIITIILLIFSISFCFGTGNDLNVRVRIRSPRQYNEQATLKGYDSITIYDNSSGKQIELFQLDSEISILLDTYYDSRFNIDTSSPKVGPYHIKLKDKQYSTYSEAKEQIAKLSISSGFYPYYDGLKYEICIGSYVDENSAYDLFNKLNQNGLDVEIINGNNKNIVVYDNENMVVFMYNNSYNIYFTSKNSNLSCNMIIIDKKPFRGMLGFYIIDNSKLISINYVDLESYLYGVVPNEIIPSWPIEAVKAQVVSARTYAASCISSESYYGYDLEDSQDSQVYRGYASEYSFTNKAVDDTKGEMVYYDGDLIQAFFHSSSGGRTENSENIWVTELPYLKSVKDEYSNISPQSEWKKVATKDYIISKLKADGNEINDLYGIQITNVSENYRVMECIFLTDKGEIKYKKENIRRVLGYDFLLSSWFSIENSNFFYFTNMEFANARSSIMDEIGNAENEVIGINSGILDAIVDGEESSITNEENLNLNESNDYKALDTGSINDKYLISSSATGKIKSNSTTAFISKTGVSIQNNNTSEYYFNGRGWGHGVGMSQYGAKQMATEGFTYEEILKYYYTGVNIK